ncbi:MAG: hypothetical protein AABZ77_09045 [Chloroflexota bacterium]
MGEFEIDEERIKDGWGGGVERKFYSVDAKYSVPYWLSNPTDGVLSIIRGVEGGRYRLHERIQGLVQEFSKRIGISI